MTLESEKATMEIPAPDAGTVGEIQVKIGDRVSQGDPILVLETGGTTVAAEPPSAAENSQTSDPASVEASEMATEVVILGAGPGGYTAAFRAADLGKKVVLIERYPKLGGVCLNVGCIPSKALLHTAQIINEAAEMERMGVRFGEPEIDLDKLRAGKESVVGKLTGGLEALAKQRKVSVVEGSGRFEAPNRIGVDTRQGRILISFDQAIVACGSSPVKIPGFPHDDPRVMDSTDALELADIPGRLLVVGGGIIDLEMATVNQALGSRIDGGGLPRRSRLRFSAADRDLGLVQKTAEGLFLAF